MRKWIFPAGYLLVAAAVAAGIYLAFRPPSAPAEIEPYGPAAPLKEKYYAAIEAEDYEAAQKAFDAHQTLLLLAASAREPSRPFGMRFDFARRYRRNLELKHEAADFALNHSGTQLWLGKYAAAKRLIVDFLELSASRPEKHPEYSRNLMRATTFLGDLDYYEGKIQRAGEWYSSAYSLCDDTEEGWAYNLIETGLANSTTSYFIETGNAAGAIEWAEFYLEMAEPGSDDPSEQLYAHGNKAAAAATLISYRQTTRALELFTEAIAGYRKALPELGQGTTSGSLAARFTI